MDIPSQASKAEKLMRQADALSDLALSAARARREDHANVLSAEAARRREEARNLIDEVIWGASEEERALGHRMKAITGRTYECEFCGAMVSDCKSFRGRSGGTVWETCHGAPAIPVNQ